MIFAAHPKAVVTAATCVAGAAVFALGLGVAAAFGSGAILLLFGGVQAIWIGMLCGALVLAGATVVVALSGAVTRVKSRFE